jgi:mRNA interferase MazF
VIVAAVTSRIHKAKLPTHIEVAAGTCGLDRDSVVLCEQVRTIDKARLCERLGMLTPQQMRQVGEAIAVSLGLM